MEKNQTNASPLSRVGGDPDRLVGPDILTQTELTTLQNITMLDFTLQKEQEMRRRRKMSKRSSKRNFRQNSGTHPKNRTPNQRGGYRL